MALWGLGWTFRSGAEDAWLADEVGADRLARAYQRGAQVERLAGLVGIGAAVGLAMVALWLPFVVAGCVSCLLALILAVAMPEHGFAKPEKDAGATATIRAGLKTVTTGRRVVRAHPILLLILAIAFVTGAWSEGGTGSGRRTCLSTSGCRGCSVSMTSPGSACWRPVAWCSPSSWPHLL